MESQHLFHKYSQGSHWFYHPEQYAKKFASFLKKKKFTDTIIDIGCGNGRDVHVFQSLGFNAIGIDTDQDVLSIAKRKFPESRFEKQNAESLTFPDNSVGACFMINVIHYVNREKAMSEAFRILKPGGFLYIHFNISITDKDGNEDYAHAETDILNLISPFTIIKKKKFKRIDKLPVKHTHTILELILQKTN
jgi:ubiquinone/menaquinone biosynthesis C-methylase UbiE